MTGDFINFKQNVITFLLFLMGGSVVASELATSKNSVAQNQEIRNCSSYRNFKLEPFGRECVTRNEDGSIKGRFQRAPIILADGTQVKGIEIVGEGLIFEDSIKTNVGRLDAKKYCQERGLDLPSGSVIEEGRIIENMNSDFELAAKRGLPEAFSGDMANKAFWSSSDSPIYNNVTYGFSTVPAPELGLGEEGRIVFMLHDDKESYYSARCVVRAK